MGASGWLCVKQSVSHSVEWYDYLIALVCGILFVVILYYLYKFCLKLQHQVIPEEPIDVAETEACWRWAIELGDETVPVEKFEEEFKFSLQDLTNWWNKNVLSI